ncbi:MAG: sulfite exporter TauE/SafE family protein [Gammaproteobacteria bacterium]|nr:sulfite exporter TauE/SafE family protein [Gammaproteobacteria bacterium]
MELWQILLLIFAGVFAGWLNVLAGGGSLLTVPIMLFMDIPAPVANGTNRIAILAQNITAVYTFFRKGFSDFRLSLTLSIAASLGAVAGAWFGVQIEGVWFNRLLAVVMIAVMILMATGKDVTPSSGEEEEPKNLILGHLLMIAAGFWGGMIQIGVGFILMAILHRVMGFGMVRVNMYKVFVVLSYTIVALWIFASQLQLLWWAGLGLALGNSIGGWYGAHTTIHKGEEWIKRVMYIMLSVFVIKLLFF